MIFLIKAKNKQKCKKKFREKKISYVYPQPKVGKSQEISGMGRMILF